MQIEPQHRTATLLESRDRLGYKTCRPTCDAGHLVRVPGDVGMCSCGRWWWFSYSPGTLPISAARAAEIAREPMPAYEVLDALERGAAELARFTA